MEPTGNEVVAQLKRLLVHLDGGVLQLIIFALLLLHYVRCLALVGQPLRVVELGVVRRESDCPVIVLMRLVILTQIQVDVAPVKVEERILVVLVNSHIIVADSVLELS